jgi:hypothetical protein
MSRFVLLYHDCPPDYVRPSHWDLMLESGDVLRTWALERLPRGWDEWRKRTAEQHPACAALADADEVAVEPLGDHRREYLEFEGEVSGGRGSVIRVARGEYVIEEEPAGAWLVSLREDGVSRTIRLRCNL